MSRPAEHNVCNEQGKAQKHVTAKDYTLHMGYTDKRDRMATSYSISQRTWKWTKYISSPHGPNYCIASSSCHTAAAKEVTENSVILVQNLLEMNARDTQTHSTSR
jgi:hypothetical protein